jgi:hypothetical protein
VRIAVTSCPQGLTFTSLPHFSRFSPDLIAYRLSHPSHSPLSDPRSDFAFYSPLSHSLPTRHTSRLPLLASDELLDQGLTAGGIPGPSDHFHELSHTGPESRLHFLPTRCPNIVEWACGGVWPRGIGGSGLWSGLRTGDGRGLRVRCADTHSEVHGHDTSPSQAGYRCLLRTQ